MILTPELVAQIEDALRRITSHGFGQVAIVVECGKPKFIQSQVSEPIIVDVRPPPPRFTSKGG